MKKLLFIMNNLQAGGAEKALVSLLQELDFSQYQVDLQLFDRSGVFLGQVPPQVRVLPGFANWKYFDMPIGRALTVCLRRGKLKTAFARAMFALAMKKETIRTRKAQRSWKYLSMAFPALKQRYDAAIGFMEIGPTYYVVNKTRAGIKIGFVHNDYEALGLSPEFDAPYFKRLDYIFTVSEACVGSLRKHFPSLSEKIRLMYNIVSPETLRRLAAVPIDFDPPGTVLVSVGRLSPQKGFDMAVDACRELVDAGLDVRWFILGEGPERAALEEKITASGLGGRFVLLGVRDNPYPYIARADVYVQPSRFEGKSVAIDEAKILAKPIVVTRFPSVTDQITHGVDGYIVPGDASGIAAGIREMAANQELRGKLRKNLESQSLGTQSEISKLLGLIGST